MSFRSIQLHKYLACSNSPISLHRIYQKTDHICPVLTQAFTRYFNIIFFGIPDLSETAKLKKLDEMRQRRKFQHHLEALQPLSSLGVSISECSEIYPRLSSSENCESEEVVDALFQEDNKERLLFDKNVIMCVLQV